MTKKKIYASNKKTLTNRILRTNKYYRLKLNKYYKNKYKSIIKPVDQSIKLTKIKGNKNNYSTYLTGVIFVALFACAAFYLADFKLLKYLSFSPLIIGIILGMLYANTLSKKTPKVLLPGITFTSKKILRLAIILYGFRLTIQNVFDVGAMAIVIDIIIIISTLCIGIFIGKILKLDPEITLLTSTGAAICGAAAVMGMEPVVENKPYKTAIAVTTVVIFGTIAMFLYPLLYNSGLFNFTDTQWALYTGSSLHEVAHVVGASNVMSQTVSESAIIVKMIRVIFLAPVLLFFAFFINRKKASLNKPHSNKVKKQKITIPWFAFGFIAMICFNSLNLLSKDVIEWINYLDTFLLTMAMTALGLETQISKFKEAGFKPFVLALIIFIWLIFAGYTLVKVLA